MMDAREKNYSALLNQCMEKGMSSKYKAFHSKKMYIVIFAIEYQSKGLDDKAFSSDDEE
ncbi:hypothetical protein J1N35_001260 [Gossypium stocksii]|uniref:Uncharacterized protein n=1 Tax=Gossypium stocksii TaxID=47602 RepID=A0A9D3WHC5_9ROSI|nr:hypothetical protein J1N35_001260 [Gossypium stocksii]